MATTKYHHEPLQQQRSIRVFTILPACNRKAPICGTLSEVTLESKPSFEALSYAWGRSALGVTITVLGRSTREAAILEVTPNCLSALQALRWRFRGRKLWIDAICIDQTSTTEKNQQVPLMAEIYGRAKQVLVHLDAGNENSAHVQQASRLIRQMGWLHRMRLLRLYEADEHTESRMPRDSKLVMACETYINSKSQSLGDSFNAIFLNGYFQRVWTVQEIAMAHAIQVHYGTSMFSWRDLITSALFTVKQEGGFLRNQGGQVDVFRDAKTHWKLLNSLESHFVLPDIFGVEALYDRRNKSNILGKLTPGTAELALVKSKGLDATEPRDKAYAMLWAFPGSSQAIDLLRQVDYDKNIEDIYTEYTAAIFVKMSGAPDQFYWVNSTRRNAALPSWVPDWNENTTIWFSLWAQHLKSFCAAKEDSGTFKVEIYGRLLRIWGVEYSTIKAIVRLTEEARQRDIAAEEPRVLVEGLMDTAELLRSFTDVSRRIMGSGGEGVLEALHRIVYSQHDFLGPGQADQRAFIGTPKEAELSTRFKISIGLLRIILFDKLSPLLDEVALQTPSVTSVLDAYLSENEIQAVMRTATELPNLPPFLSVAASISPFIDIYRFLYNILTNHRDKDFFLTEKGNMGIAFHGLSGDDIIAVWKGCPSPMVVRKAESDGRSFYRFHSPAHVDGIMNGEAWVNEGDALDTFELL